MENPRRLYRIYSDVCEPFDIEDYFQSQYFMMFVDSFSYYVRVKPIRSKDEAFKVLKEWITCSKIETEEKANLLRTDEGGKYMGTEFQEWLRSRGMHHEMTNANIRSTQELVVICGSIYTRNSEQTIYMSTI